MSEKRNLWFFNEQIKRINPAGIFCYDLLSEQAQVLGQITKGRLEGKLRFVAFEDKDGNTKTNVTLSVFAAALDKTFDVLRVKGETQLGQLGIAMGTGHVVGNRTNTYAINNIVAQTWERIRAPATDEALVEAVRAHLGSDAVRLLIHSLMAEVKQARMIRLRSQSATWGAENCHYVSNLSGERALNAVKTFKFE